MEKWEGMKERNEEFKSGCLSCMSCIKDVSQEVIYRCVCILASYLIWGDLPRMWLYVVTIKAKQMPDSIYDSFLITTLSKVDSCNQNKQGADSRVIAQTETGL